MQRSWGGCACLCSHMDKHTNPHAHKRTCTHMHVHTNARAHIYTLRAVLSNNVAGLWEHGACAVHALEAWHLCFGGCRRRWQPAHQCGCDAWHQRGRNGLWPKRCVCVHTCVCACARVCLASLVAQGRPTNATLPLACQPCFGVLPPWMEQLLLLVPRHACGAARRSHTAGLCMSAACGLGSNDSTCAGTSPVAVQ